MNPKVRSSLSTFLFSFTSKSHHHLFSINLFHSFSAIKTGNPKPLVVDYLIRNCGLSETHALAAAKHLPRINTQTADSVLLFLQESGFSETQTREAVRICPQILRFDTKRNLKPKLEFFQDLGLTGTKLIDFISRNSIVLVYSLNKRLIPFAEALKITLTNNEDFMRALLKCRRLLYQDVNTRLLPNISYLQSCGIVGSQLSWLLRTQPTLVVSSQDMLRNLADKVEKMGISVNSKMFVYALCTVSFMKPEVLQRKFELLRSFGLSEEETLAIFRKAPCVLSTSQKKLKLGMEFFVNTLRYEPSVMVTNPSLFIYSMEKRVIPRYKVVEALKVKKLMKKIPSFIGIILMAESNFLDKFISRFEDHAEELMKVYNERQI